MAVVKGDYIERSQIITEIKSRINAKTKASIQANSVAGYVSDSAHQLDPSRVAAGTTLDTTEFDRINYVLGTMDINVDNIIDTLIANALLCTQVRRVRWTYLTFPNDPADPVTLTPTSPLRIRLDIEAQIWYDEFSELARRYNIDTEAGVLADIIAASNGTTGYTGIPTVQTGTNIPSGYGNIYFDSTKQLLRFTDNSAYVRISERRATSSLSTIQMSLVEVNSSGEDVLTSDGLPVYKGAINAFVTADTGPGILSMIKEIENLLDWHRANSAVIDISSCHSNCHTNCHSNRNRR